MAGLMDETEALLRAVLPPTVRSGGVETRLDGFERVTMVDAFDRWVGADLLSTADDAGGLAAQAGVRLRGWGGVGRPVLSAVAGQGGAQVGAGAAELPDALAGRPGGFGPARPGRPARGPAVRAVCVRNGIGQCFRGVDGPCGAAGAVRGGPGAAARGERGGLADGRGVVVGAGVDAGLFGVARWGSIGWRCWRLGRTGSGQVQWLPVAGA